MSNINIRVEKLSKQYKIGAVKQRYHTLRDELADGFKSLFSFNGRRSDLSADHSASSDTIWALKDVSFEVEEGEVLGIIGRNGAGKSTLLKILSRITQPTEGRASIYGRVGSLLEVGTGFSGELTGRENVYLNGAILGMKKTEIERKFDEIVAFAGFEKFIDTPVKRYSSGMYMRLAFAVAAHLEPEILIVDEVLAVGDAQFQKKCLGKMGDVAKEGRTVLFVSHNMLAVATLCNSAIWLEGGGIKQRGTARGTVQQYLADTSQRMSSWIDVSSQSRIGKLGQQLRIVAVEWLTEIPLSHSENVRWRIYFESRTTLDGVSLTLGFSTLDGIRLLSYDTDSRGYRARVEQDRKSFVEFSIQDFPLAPGVYNLDVGSRTGDTFTLDYLPGFARIEVSLGAATQGYMGIDTGVRLVADCLWDSGLRTEPIGELQDKSNEGEQIAHDSRKCCKYDR